jgi:hypothetical protein
MPAGVMPRTGDPAVDLPSASPAGSPVFDHETIAELAAMLGIEHHIRIVLGDCPTCAPTTRGCHYYDGERHIIHVKIAGRDVRDVNRTTLHELAHAGGFGEGQAQAFARMFASRSIVREAGTVIAMEGNT